MTYVAIAALVAVLVLWVRRRRDKSIVLRRRRNPWED